MPPGDRLEKLDVTAPASTPIRISDRYRICFAWTDTGPDDVEITDYHRAPPEETNMATTTKAHDPITPGEILLTEFLKPLSISQYRLSQATGLPQTRISQIDRGGPDPGSWTR